MPDRVARQKKSCLAFMSPVNSTVAPWERSWWIRLSSRRTDSARHLPALPCVSAGLWVFSTQNRLPLVFDLSSTSGMLTRLP